jgi:tetratricopeptide (TPR) repeat protein
MKRNAVALTLTILVLFTAVGVMAQDRQQEALEHYKRGTELAAKLIKDKQSLSRPDRAAAIAEFRAALKLKPDFAAARSYLGLCLVDNGEVDAGLAECREAEREDPENVQLLDPLYSILSLIKQDAEGQLEVARKAVRLAPNNLRWHLRLAHALQFSGNDEEALTEYRLAVRQHPDETEAYEMFASALEGEGDWSGAVAEYRAAVRQHPDATDTREHLARALIGQGDWNGAIAEYREAVRFRPQDDYLRSVLDRIQKDKTRLDQMTADQRQAVHLKPDDAGAHWTLGRLLQTNGQWQEASAEYRKALSLGEQNAECHYWLGRALEQMGDLDGAIAELRNAVWSETEPYGTPARLCLAHTFAKKGDHEAACEQRRMALEADPIARSPEFRNLEPAPPLPPPPPPPLAPPPPAPPGEKAKVRLTASATPSAAILRWDRLAEEEWDAHLVPAEISPKTSDPAILAQALRKLALEHFMLIQGVRVEGDLESVPVITDSTKTQLQELCSNQPQLARMASETSAWLKEHRQELSHIDPAGKAFGQSRENDQLMSKFTEKFGKVRAQGFSCRD